MTAGFVVRCTFAFVVAIAMLGHAQMAASMQICCAGLELEAPASAADASSHEHGAAPSQDGPSANDCCFCGNSCDCASAGLTTASAPSPADTSVAARARDVALDEDLLFQPLYQPPRRRPAAFHL